MSQGIQERNLPVADSIGEGDKVRIVTAQGNSKNVDASQIGGGGMRVNVIGTSHQTIDKSYNELHNAVMEGVLPILIETSENNAEQVFVVSSMLVGSNPGGTFYSVVFSYATFDDGPIVSMLGCTSLSADVPMTISR